MSKIYEALTKKTAAQPQSELGEMFDRGEEAVGLLSSEGPGETVTHVASPKPVQQLSPSAQFPLDWERIRSVSLRVADVSPVLPFGGEHPAAAEQYRLLRTRMTQSAPDCRFVLVTSAGPGEGKTVTSINLAGALSLKSTAKVLLIDGDLRRSSIPSVLGIPESPGLADVVARDAALGDAIVRAVEFPNLYILPAGKAKCNPSEIFDSVAWREVVTTIRASFDQIVSDCPPMGPLADFDLLEAACDRVLLVVRPDHTRRAHLNEAMERISKDKLLGTVLNCFSDWIFRRVPEYPGSYA